MKGVYLARFIQFMDGSNYYASIPALYGCATTGKTLKEATENIADALNLFVLVLEEIGDDIPEPNYDITPFTDLYDGEWKINVEYYALIPLDTEKYTLEMNEVDKTAGKSLQETV